MEKENMVKVLPGGLRFAFKKSTSPVAYCALSIRCGTAMEPEEYGGLSHFAEHMIFKGTEKRTATSINNRLERLGGELNAFTSKDEIVVYSTILKEDLPKAIDLIFEIVFTSKFDEKEIAKERQVVIDEINLYKDSPSDYIFDDFEEFLFKGYPLSRSVLGKSSSLKKITSATLKDYTSGCFVPCNMTLGVVGDFDCEAVAKLSEKLLAKYAKMSGDGQEKIEPKYGFPCSTVFTKDCHKKNHQSNCIIGAEAYSVRDPRKIALLLLTNILGGPSSNSVLNTVLRERNALVYNVEAVYTQYLTTGVALFYFGCEKHNVDKCIELILKELERFRTVLLSERALKSAKKQMLGQLAISSDNGEAQALAISKSIMTNDKYLSDDEIRQKVEAVTAEDILSCANDIFASDKISMLIYR